MRRPQYDLLKSLGIRFIVFHEEVYPQKISDFPFRVTVENLRASKYLETVAGAPPLWLFRLKPEPPAGEEFAAGGISPVGSLREAEQWNAGRGTRVEDPLASGGAAIAFPAGAAGVLGRPVPARVYPAGSYRAQARFLAERPGAAPGMTLEVRQADSGSSSPRPACRPGSVATASWTSKRDFTLKTLEKIFTQVVSDGSAPVRWDLRAGALRRRARAAAVDRDRGALAHGGPARRPRGLGGAGGRADPRVQPARLRVLRPRPGAAGRAPGSPRLRFGAAAAAGAAGGERFEVAISNVERPLAAVSLPAAGTGGYREVALPFSLSRSDAGALSGVFPRAAAAGARPDLDRPRIAAPRSRPRRAERHQDGTSGRARRAARRRRG